MNDPYPFIFNAALPLVIALAYFFRKRLAYSAAFVAVIPTTFLLFKLGAPGSTIVLAAALFIGTPYLISRFNLSYKKSRTELEGRLKDLKDEHARLHHEEEELGHSAKAVDGRMTDIISLYEITKEMSAALNFEQLFKTFSAFLWENFSFSICRLALVNREEMDVSTVDKVYNIEGRSSSDSIDEDFPNIHSVEPDSDDKLLISYLSSTKKPLLIDSKKNLHDPTISFISEGAKTFIAAPLVVGEKLVAALSMSNLPPNDFDKIVIQARQFALEIKKIQLYETIQHLAITDGLTNLFVRRHFIERFDEELRRSRRQKLRMVLLMLDIDHFKICNDRYGHLVGDAVLREISKIIRDSVREIDMVARYGGEEFAVLLPDTKKEEAAHVAERIRSAISLHEFKAYDELIRCTISIGVASYPSDSPTMESLIESADLALYKAKALGRDKVCLFKRDMRESE
ncbi:MAG: diguanylate cyclase [Candidatus Omnitrophica bacterium]|nr:diguanylate cyclase [Candidatus Omnitrophota bacterium]